MPDNAPCRGSQKHHRHRLVRFPIPHLSQSQTRLKAVSWRLQSLPPSSSLGEATDPAQIRVIPVQNTNKVHNIRRLHNKLNYRKRKKI